MLSEHAEYIMHLEVDDWTKGVLMYWMGVRG